MSVKLDQARIHHLTITQDEAKPGIEFSRESYNYLVAPKNGVIAFSPGSASGAGATTGAGARLAVLYNAVIPGQNDNLINLGSIAYHWNVIHGKKLALNASSEPTENLYVNGTARFAIGDSDTVSAKRVIIGSSGNRYLSFGGAGIQAYNASDAGSVLYLQYQGGSITIGQSASITSPVTIYGNLLAGAKDTYNIGSEEKPWNKLYIKSVQVTSANGSDPAFKEIRTGGSTVSFGVGSGNVNHGIYSNTLGKWIAYADTSKIYLNGNANTATALATGRTLQVALGSSNVSTAFDGTANVHDIGVSGVLPATHGGTGLSALVTPTVTWTGGTTNGPTLKIKDSLGKESSAVAVPKATGTASGIVTTGTQTFAGAKTFTSTPTFKNAHYYASCHFMPSLRASGEARTGVIYSFVGSSSSDTAISTNYFAFRQYSYTTGSTEVLSKFDQFALPTTVADKTANNYYSILTTKDKVTVAQGGTGLGTLTAGYALIGNGTSAVSLRPITNNTSVGASGWSGSVGTNLITHNTLAYWNGAYSGTTSNLSILGTVTTGVWHGSVIGVGYGGTGQTTAKNACNAFLNALDTGSSVPVDADYYISQYVGGGTTTTTYHRRPVSALYSYIKGKLDSVYAAKSHSHSYLPLSGGTMTGHITMSGATQIKSAHTGGSYWKARDLALVRHTAHIAASSYAPIYAMQGLSGDFACGLIHYTSGESKIEWRYTTNTGYNASSNSGSSLLMQLDSAGTLTATKVYGAVWNDYAEYRNQFENISTGRVAYCKNDGRLRITTERLQKFEGVVSDTFGFAIGETDNAKTPLAVSGRVLVYTYEPRNTFNSGDCVCAAPNGTVSKMSREEIVAYPDRIVGIVSEIPEYETWSTDEVPVNGRIWIKVK